MVAGFNMLSFDLFGLGRKAQEDNLKRESGVKSESKPTKDESEQHDRDQQHELFFWSLYPVI
ncbi:hypothetical protein RMR16_021495 [Agrobacterium sp. rho-13.3]|uniref:hypothetical protein n=1 Tax=Agrobacterium sp. rho-13.3 TaxID=3072980 RepID=UPI002A130924|nr:hypothetical protein [Agrobacterium sp. rho-13.3]MDX8306483.1 hypothetical protein [Agrobacterium sp. rho-13.3]MDX8307186.1 hypothetical protein [Agrobacterium sp. rho-13.3]